MRITLTPKMDHFTFLDGPFHFLVVENLVGWTNGLELLIMDRWGKKEWWAMFRLQNGGRTLVKHNNQL